MDDEEKKPLNKFSSTISGKGGGGENATSLHLDELGDLYGLSTDQRQ